MKSIIDIVMITNRSRPELLCQSVNSIYLNSSYSIGKTLTVVFDQNEELAIVKPPPIVHGSTFIFNGIQRGASASRNIGAGSIPKHRRGEYVLFLDDDVYMCPHWDEALLLLAEGRPCAILSGYGHPFNQYDDTGTHHYYAEPGTGIHWGEPLVISSVAMMMPWETFDEVGPWDEPGGPGASEDYALCMRAKSKRYGFGVTEPQRIIHVGLRSTSGEKIVGYDELYKQNTQLIEQYELQDKVEMAL